MIHGRKNWEVGLYENVKLLLCKLLLRERTSHKRILSQEGKKRFAKHISEKELVPKIYKELLKLNNMKMNNQINKWEKYLNRHLTKEDLRWKISTWKYDQHHICKSHHSRFVN